ncbi:MAG: efflux RND transporter periplasmic adaptor subunit [Sphingobacteriales bacterium]|nr:efflux RND transporter periplasmic adaptor subunit [Sphingobacteriales bacterium]MBI3718621.1 efflux RND transporter periplasmic adaptor subunit [Sphingobacteriales bacterium]
MIKKILILLLFIPSLVFAHGGEDDEGSKKTTVKPAAYFSSEAISDVYELLVKYQPLLPGKEATFKLFVSDFNTNVPVDSATLQIAVADNPNIKLAVTQIDEGVYEVKGIFPEKKSYNLTVNINSSLGPDLILINNITIGKELEKPATAVHADMHWYQSTLFFGISGLLSGLLLMFFVMKRTNRKVAASIIILLCLLPTATYNTASAHGGEDDEAGSKSGGAMSSTFMVEKESQFLFGILTQKIETGNFNQSTQVLGTIIPSSQGRAVIQSPQTGKIISLKVSVGQRVSSGQVLAVIEQQVDAGTQINILSQRNAVDAEFNAAKAQYDRLKAIEDIAAKKDVTEAKARYETASKNKQLFTANAERSTGNTKMITLTAPISGVVGAFNYSIGAVVNAGETLFDITNLEKVLVETQVFANDAAQLKSVENITASSNIQNDTTTYRLKLVSTAQSVNGANQSQKVIFEIINPKSQFKIGENIKVFIFSKDISTQVIVPSNAIAEINGKPAVFVKDKAEQYSISYINKGTSNGKYTTIIKGVEEGERVVTTGVYQMKTIYLNQ